MIGVGFKSHEIIETESLQQVLVGVRVSCEREAFHIYNDYAYKVRFGVCYLRTGNRCKSEGGELCMCQFYLETGIRAR